MSKNDGGPAFPVADLVGAGLRSIDVNPTTGAPSGAGMSLRDYFAAKAMVALLANALDNEITFDGYDSFDEMIAEQAYEQADAMLRARSTATGEAG